MDAERSARTVMAARSVARAASFLASEAAGLARIYADHGPAEDAALMATEASVRATRASMSLEAERPATGDEALKSAIRASLASLEAASAVAATRAALDAAMAVRGRGGLGGSLAG